MAPKESLDGNRRLSLRDMSIIFNIEINMLSEEIELGRTVNFNFDGLRKQDAHQSNYVFPRNGRYRVFAKVPGIRGGKIKEVYLLCFWGNSVRQ